MWKVIVPAGTLFGAEKANSVARTVTMRGLNAGTGDAAPVARSNDSRVIMGKFSGEVRGGITCLVRGSFASRALPPTHLHRHHHPVVHAVASLVVVSVVVVPDGRRVVPLEHVGV